MSILNDDSEVKKPPIQSNLYCKNTADRTQQNNRQTQRKTTLKNITNIGNEKKVTRMPVMKSVGVFVQQSNDKVFSC